MSTSGKTALLVIDTQVALLDGAYRSDEVIGAISGLLAKAREAGAAVIYMQHDGDPGERLEPGAPGWAIHPALAPRECETVLRKRASDSFYRTELRAELEARGITGMVVTGLRTERCVDTTSRQAVSLGYDVTLATDAHTTKDTDALPAERIIAHTNENLDDFGNDEHVVTVKQSEEVVF